MKRYFTATLCSLALGSWMALPGAVAQNTGGGGGAGAGGGTGGAAAGGAASGGQAAGGAQAAGGGQGSAAGQTGGAQSPAGQAQGGASPAGQAQRQGGQSPSGQAQGGATPGQQAQGQQGRSPAGQAQGQRGRSPAGQAQGQQRRSPAGQARGNRGTNNQNQNPRRTRSAPDIGDRRDQSDNRNNRDMQDPNQRNNQGIDQGNRPRTAGDIEPGPSGNERNDGLNTTPQQSQPGSGIGLPGSAQPGSGTGLPGARDQDGRANPGANQRSNQPSFLNDTGIADQLGFDQQQYQQVGQSYQQAWDRYQQARAQLGDDLSNEERSRRLSTLRDQFNRDFLEGAGQAFANPLQQQRFRQLQMQYQGYGAFSDPTLQDELQLSAEQIVRFNRMQEQWNQQLQQFQQGGQDGNYFRDSDAAQTQNGVRQTQFQDGGEGARNGDPSQRFQQLMRQRWQQINNILDEDQRYRYYQSVGAPHDFPMEAYLQTGSGGGAAASAQGTTAPGAGVQDTETQGVNPQGTAPQGNTPGANTPQRSTTPQSSAPGTARDGAAGAASGQGNPRG